MVIKDLEKTIWETAGRLRYPMDAAQHRYMVLGLIFLKYILDAFNSLHRDLKGEGNLVSSNRGERKKFLQQDVFYLPDKAQWSFLEGKARQPHIGSRIDEVIDIVEKLNDNLRGIFPKNYSNRDIDNVALGELVILIGNIGLKKQGREKKYLYGRVFEYLLKRFSEDEGPKGGQFYTPESIAKLLVEMVEPRKGRIYDGCCGTGGIFIQSEKFIKEHHSKIGNQLFYGQELDPTTVKLAKMNLGIHGIDASLKCGDTFSNDCHPTLKADFIIAHPPFNQRVLQTEWPPTNEWPYGVPPRANANYAWLQHFISKLSSEGKAGIVLPVNSLYSKTGKETEIRKNLVEDRIVDCIVALPPQLFYNSPQTACLWLLARNKTNNRYTDATNEILFIDAGKLGEMANEKNRVLSNEDISLVSKTYLRWRNINGDYTDIKGFCKAVSIEEIRRNGYNLNPGRFIADRRVMKPLFAVLSMILFVVLYFTIFRRDLFNSNLFNSKSSPQDTAITVQSTPLKDSIQSVKKITKKEKIVKNDTGEVKDRPEKNLTENKTIELKPPASIASPAREADSSSLKTSGSNGRTASVTETQTRGQTNPPSARSYKVVSKAYFHDQPDESTRRKAFINHWNNSYATIKPLDEKNEFIYVVFTNHLNQTSKGWLKKKDLREVNQ